MARHNYSKCELNFLNKAVEQNLTTHDVADEFRKRFECTDVSNGAIGLALRRCRKKLGKTESVVPIIKRGKNPLKILQRSNYLVLVFDRVQGFDTEEEVSEFLKKSQILGGVKLFKAVPIEIKYDISIGR